MFTHLLSTLALLIPLTAQPPEAPPTDTHLQNLRSIAKTAGYLRYFSPSDEAVAADWNQVIIAAIVRCESAETPLDLARCLEVSFAWAAPGGNLQIGRPPAPAQLATEALDQEAMAWLHHGLGREDEGRVVYHSTRRRFPVGEARTQDPPALPPGAAIHRELDRGIWCVWYPTLKLESGRTAPAGDAPPPLPRPLPPATDEQIARAERIASVIIPWNVFQHFYPYFDVVEVDWDEVLSESLRRGRAAATDRQLLDVLRWQVAQLQDGHGLVQHPSDPITHTLPLDWRMIDHQLVITAAGPELPSLRPGEIVRRVDGVPAANVWRDRRELVSAATEGSREFKTAQQLLMGGPGTVSLEIEALDGELRAIEISRIPRASGIREVEAWIPPRKSFIDLGENIYYLDLDRLTVEELQQLLPTLVDARGLVLDMRGYPRRIGFGLLGSFTDVPMQTPTVETPLVTLPDRENLAWNRQSWPLSPQRPRLTDNIAFIIDGRVVSAAEHFLGTARGAGIGIFVGEPTAGTNGNINPFELPGGYRVVWTGMRVLGPDLTQHHGIGIRPDVPVSPTLEGIRAGRDELFDKAVEVIRAAAQPKK